jgi:hypothetical protein
LATKLYVKLGDVRVFCFYSTLIGLVTRMNCVFLLIYGPLQGGCVFVWIVNKSRL